MALGDRAGTVFPKGFYMPRVHCVQARDFCIWRQLAPPPRPPSRPTWKALRTADSVPGRDSEAVSPQEERPRTSLEQV